MRPALIRILSIAATTTTCVIAFAQLPEPKNTGPKKDEKPQELGPATSRTKEEAAEAAKAPATLPALPTAAPVDPKSYVIGPEDILFVHVWRENELSSSVQVRPDGRITLPLIGELDASGLTPEALKGKIVEALTEYINKPEVTVSVRSVLSKKYYITGQVNRPGSFPLVVPTTILEALTNAGGFREFANTKKIRIMRQGTILKFNYNEVIDGKKLDQNILVQNGDYIIVQ